MTQRESTTCISVFNKNDLSNNLQKYCQDKYKRNSQISLRIAVLGFILTFSSFNGLKTSRLFLFFLIVQKIRVHIKWRDINRYKHYIAIKTAETSFKPSILILTHFNTSKKFLRRPLERLLYLMKNNPRKTKNDV